MLLSFYFPDRICRDFTIEQIHGIVASFGRAALRAKQAEAGRIIVDVGASSVKLYIPGIDNKNVVEVTAAHLNPSLIKDEKIVVGGGMSGCDCALELAMEGKKVTIVEMQDALCPQALLDNRNQLMFKLEDYHVEELTSTKILEFTKDGVVVENKDGKKVIPADTVISVFGTRSNNSMISEITEKYPTASVIGDCTKVAQVGEAAHGGFFADWSIYYSKR